jgi:heat shock protein HtpX
MLLGTVVVVLVGFVSILADMFMRSALWGGGRRDDRDNSGVILLLALLFSLLAPIAATLIQLAISRKREFLADASGALLTRYPEGLARALEKIAADPTPMAVATNTTAHLWLADPFKAQSKTPWLRKLFMTHPPIEERIRALRGMEV